MPNGVSPVIPEGTNIFTEIGLGTEPSRAQGPRQADAELDQVFSALQSGDTGGLVSARDLLNNIVTKRIAQVKPGAETAGVPTPREAVQAQQPSRPAQPAQIKERAPTPPERPTVPAPVGSVAGGAQQTQSSSVLQDIVKIIREASKLSSPSGSLTAQAQPTGVTPQPPGRRPL